MEGKRWRGRDRWE
jgi:hypothetical protein